MADSDLSKWAGAGIALLAAGGGYVGSAVETGKAAGALEQRVEMIQAQLQDHDLRERNFEAEIRSNVADIDARVRVLESRK